MSHIQDLLNILEAYEKTPESYGVDLRLDVADLILEALEQKGWTKKQLAEKAGMKPSYLSRLIHTEANCTLDVIGRLCHAIGFRPQLTKKVTVNFRVDRGEILATIGNQQWGKNYASEDEKIGQQVKTLEA